MLRGGGNNTNMAIPGFVEENRAPYDNNALPQLQLFGHVPAQRGHMPNSDSKVREGGSSSMHHKPPALLNKSSCPDEVGFDESFLNLKIRLSTGLKLFGEDEERNSSVTSAFENMKSTTNVPVMLSLGNTVKMEIDRQAEEFDRYIKLQEQSIVNSVRDMHRSYTASLLAALEKGVARKIHEKDLVIENLNRKNHELVEKIQRASMEAQSWQHKAIYNESIVSSLKAHIQQQLVEQNAAAHQLEGSGDSSEVDDAVSCPGSRYEARKCRVCGEKDVSVLILPCRHLCLCADCEGFAEVCPVCPAVKTASVCVYM